MLNFARWRALSAELGIHEGDRVLDIGCGGTPFPLATHLADVSLTDNSGRFGLAIPRGPRPVYECPVERTPFANEEFDFVYCSHVLEHVVDPGSACRELMRIAKRGYIECPRSWVEYVFSAPDHRWLVDHERNTLIFREKSEKEAGDPLGIRYSIFAWLKDPRFNRHWNSQEMHALRTVQFLWEGSFDFVVIPRAEREDGGAKAGVPNSPAPLAPPVSALQLSSRRMRQ
jgi:ubiquinone/menaquinone biosynthesis C-methylase UbiE